MAPQLEAAKQQCRPAASSNGPTSCTRAAAQRQQLAAAETVWPLLLQHDSIRTQLRVACKLLCCSKSTAAAVADHSAGQLDIPEVEPTAAAAIAAWLRKHAVLARSMDLTWICVYPDAAIRTSVAAALAAAQLQSVKISYADNALPLLEQLPASSMTHLDFGAYQVGAVQPIDLPSFAVRVSAALGRLTALRSLCLQWLGYDLQSPHCSLRLPGLAALTQLTALRFIGLMSDLQHVPHQQLLQLDINGYQREQQPLDLQHMAAVTALTSRRLIEGDALPPHLLRLRVDRNMSAQPLLRQQHLQQLHLRFVSGPADITAAQLQQLSRLTALSLGYYGVPETEPASAAAWHKLPLLQQLELSRVVLSAPVCQHLAQLSGLISLQLQLFALQADSATQLAAALRQLSGLQQLRLSDARWVVAATVGDVKTQEQQRAAGMQQLAQAISSLAQLRALYLSDVPQLAAAAAGSDSLTALTSLTALSMARCALMDASVAAIVLQLPGLQSLDCHISQQLTDTALLVIGQLQQLKELWLSDTGVTDAGLQQLCGLGRLKKLDVRGTRVTDVGLCHLTGLSQLQRLCVSRDGVTAQQRRWLKQQLPELCIVFW